MVGIQEPYLDTDRAAERVLLEALRAAPIWKKAALTSGLIETVRALALADIRRQHPTASEATLHLLLARRLLPSNDVDRLLGQGVESPKA